MAPEQTIELDWEIDGVPCVIEVVGVTPGEPETGPYFQGGEMVDPGTPKVEPEIEYRLLDVTGEESDLLSGMVDSDEHWQIIEAIEEAFKQDNSYRDY